jgi:protein gp37
MATRSSIEWTEMTWNPVTGCTKVSQGCKNCYAERMAKRLRGMGVWQYRNGFDVTLAPQVLTAPFEWKEPRLVFVNSMSDLFHEAVPEEYIQDVFQVMLSTPQHTYQILTKRAERLSALSASLTWPENVWMGVSVENQAATNRIQHLVSSGAGTKFLSVEPLIGPISKLPLRDINWVIVGGESGPRARPMDKAWVDAIRHQCSENGIPFFFKQWGKPQFNANPADPTIDRGHPMHAKGGCQLDGVVYREHPVARPQSRVEGVGGGRAPEVLPAAGC